MIITGASGFVGGTFAIYFSQHGFEVTGVSINKVHGASYPVRTITYQVEEVVKLVNELQPSFLIHAAGSASVGESVINPARDFSNSVALFRTVLEGVRLSGQKPVVVFPSSAAVYGNPETLPVKETAALNPISPYGFHKVMCEQLAREYSVCFNIPTLALRLFSVFGPRQKRLLVWELFRQFRSASQVLVEGTGNESRDYLSVDDLAAALAKLLAVVHNGHTVVNMGSGRSVTVREMAELIKVITHSPKDILYQGMVRPGNPMNWKADISYWQKLIGNNININFDEALKSCLDTWSSEK
jgi:UDP-glucose 4-epimerase